MIFKDLTKWQTWVYFVLLTAWIFYPTHYYSGFLEEKVVAGLWYAWILLFIWYVILIFIGNMLLVFLLKKIGLEV